MKKNQMILFLCTLNMCSFKTIFDMHVSSQCSHLKPSLWCFTCLSKLSFEGVIKVQSSHMCAHFGFLPGSGDFKAIFSSFWILYIYWPYIYFTLCLHHIIDFSKYTISCDGCIFDSMLSKFAFLFLSSNITVLGCFRESP